MAAAEVFTRGEDFAVVFDSKNDIQKPDNVCEGLRIEGVSVVLSHEYDSRPADAEFESEKDSIWESRKTKTPDLYNASKFRLKGVECRENCLTLYLGLTDYKSYICTNMREDKRQHLRRASSDRYGDQRSCFADPLGVGAVVVSRDKQVVFIRRSHRVYEAPGMVDTPGGHPEPIEVKFNDGEVQDADLEQMDPRAVVHELFDSMVREVRDEVNIPEHCMSQPQLLGIIRNHSTGGRPALCFLVNCTQSGKEIQENYRKGCPEAFESTELLLVRTSEVQAPELSSEMRALFPEFTPGCKACLYFYVRHLEGTTDRVEFQ